MGKELFLDTKGTCFLCLQESTEAGSDADEILVEEICLRNICRYLKINQCSVLLKSLLGNDVVVEEDKSSWKEKCDFSVLLCFNCSSLVKNISNLINQMEITKMLMDHQIREFNQIIHGAGQETGSHDNWERLQQKMIVACDNPVELELVENLRHETLKMCSLKVKNMDVSAFPKVMVNRLKPKMDIKPSLEIIPSPPTSFPSNSSLCPNLGQTAIVETYPMSKESVKSIFVDCFVKLTVINGNRYRCKHCNFQVGFDRYKFGRHLANVHPEVLFAATKLPEISEKKFKYCCQRLLISTSPIKNKANRHYRHRSCGICSKTYSKPRELKYHLVLEHFTRLEEKLVLLQRQAKMDNEADNQEVPGDEEPESSDEEPPPILEDQTLPNYDDLNGTYAKIYESSRNRTSNCIKNRKSHTGSNSKTWICNLKADGCGKSFTSSHSLKRHNANYCSDRNLGKVWRCKIENGGCSRKFTSNLGLARHRKEKCLKLKVARKKKNFCQNLEQNDTKKWICMVGSGGCSKKFARKNGLERHCKYYCSKNVSGKVFKCTSDNGRVGCGKGFVSPFALENHRKYSYSKNAELAKPTVCNVGNGGCGKRLKSALSLRKHLKFSCPKKGRKNLVFCCLDGGGCGRSFCLDSSLKRHQAGRCPMSSKRGSKKEK